MGNDSKVINIGGVSYPQGTTYTPIKIDGKNGYRVQLRSGIVLEHCDQTSQKASVRERTFGYLFKKDYTNISNIDGLRIVGSENRSDRIFVNSCMNVDVDLSNNPNAFIGDELVITTNESNPHIKVKKNPNDNVSKQFYNKETKEYCSLQSTRPYEFDTEYE